MHFAPFFTEGRLARAANIHKTYSILYLNRHDGYLLRISIQMLCGISLRIRLFPMVRVGENTLQFDLKGSVLDLNRV